MDELAPLIQQLQAEVTGLERALRLRQAEEDQRLDLEEARRGAAEQRLARARAALKSRGEALVALEAQRTLLRARTDGWRGQVWRIGHASAAALAVGAAVAAIPLTAAWLGRDWAAGLAAGQVALFVALYLLIPKQR